MGLLGKMHFIIPVTAALSLLVESPFSSASSESCRRNDERVISSALHYEVSHGVKSDKRHFLIMYDSTVGLSDKNVVGRKFGKVEADSLINRNREVGALSFVPKNDLIIFVTTAEVKNLFAEKKTGQDSEWEEFYKTFPGAGGLINVSLPGYSDDEAAALVYLVRQAGPLEAEGFIIELHCRTGDWIPIRRESLWHH